MKGFFFGPAYERCPNTQIATEYSISIIHSYERCPSLQANRDKRGPILHNMEYGLIQMHRNVVWIIDIFLAMSSLVINIKYHPADLVLPEGNLQIWIQMIILYLTKSSHCPARQQHITKLAFWKYPD